MNLRKAAAALLSAALLAGLLPPAALAADAGQANFTRGREYTAGQFSDISDSAWYAADVAAAYEYGLMNGTAADRFKPAGSITLAESVALACRLHDIYQGGSGVFEQGEPWYAVYRDYAEKNGIIAPGAYGSFTAAATRADFAAILARALPSAALPAVNEITAIPDVDAGDFSGAPIYRLYRAGVLTGSDAYGCFRPHDTIERSAAAAIAARMAEPALRKSFTLQAAPGNHTHGAAAAELARIAALNGKEPSALNMTWQDGYVTFLGAPYTSEKIRSESDALASLSAVSALLGLDGVELEFHRADVSPAAGYTYYTFYQVIYTDYMGASLPVYYYNSTVKVIVDRRGRAVGLASDVEHGPAPDVTTTVIPAAAAEKLVRAQLPEGTKLHSSATTLALLDDPNAVSGMGRGRAVPVWAVYTDAEPDAAARYDVYLVYAMEEPWLDASMQEMRILRVYPWDTLDIVTDFEGEYLSKLFFRGMEPGGEYDYTLDMSWAEEAGTGYTGPETISVTLPVMYEPATGLYYLGDCERGIAVSNGWDLVSLDSINPLVTATPEAPESWHFRDEATPDGKPFFCDFSYIASSYNTMLAVYDGFSSRFGYNSVDSTGQPLLLCVYAPDDFGADYPDSPSDFAINAFNCGQMMDWNIFMTSPALSGAVSYVVLAHEFTHGTNSQLDAMMYLNGPGALAEAYADVIGSQMAQLCIGRTGEDAWLIGGGEMMVIRSMSEPRDYGSPAYIGGSYFVNPIYAPSMELLDQGGVHTNSGVANYLAFRMVTGGYVTVEQNLDIWMESLYGSTAGASYSELGARLLFSAQALGLCSDALTDLLADYGFLGGSDALQQFIAEENGSSYDIRLQYEDESDADRFTMSGLIIAGDGSVLNMGQANPEGILQYRARPVDDAVYALLADDLSRGFNVAMLPGIPAVPGTETAIRVRTADAKAGTRIDLAGSRLRLVTMCETDADGDVIHYEGGSRYRAGRGETNLALTHAGSYTLLLSDPDGLLILYLTVEGSTR